jgi:hypothetical protein
VSKDAGPASRRNIGNSAGPLESPARSSEPGLHWPKPRSGVEPAVEDESRILTIAGHCVLPRLRQAAGGIDAEEVRQCGPSETVEMFVCPKQRQLSTDRDAGLFVNFPTCRLSQVLTGMNAARRNLRAGIGLIAMVEDE